MSTTKSLAAIAWTLALLGADVSRDTSKSLDRITFDADGLRKAYERADRLGIESRGLVFQERVAPHWFGDNTRFWYRNDLKERTHEFILVDARAGTRAPAFDHARLANGLAKVSNKEVKADRLPFDTIEFAKEGKAVAFRVGDVDWVCDLGSYVVTKSVEKPKPPAIDIASAVQRRLPRGSRPTGPTSPDGRWLAETINANVVVRPLKGEGKPIVLTHDGTAGLAYGAFQWSPDSKTLVAYRIDAAEPKPVHRIESSPSGGGRAKLLSQPYPLPGDKFPSYEMSIFHVEEKWCVKARVDRVDFHGPPRLRWSKDSTHFTYEKTDRGHQRFRVIEVDARTGKSRAIIDEQSKTFVNTYNVTFLEYLDDTGEILWRSERDGWSRLYLVDAKTGTIKNALTQGPWVMRGVERVDPKARQVWFQGSGKVEGQDPYLIHSYRVNFDGTGLVDLTPGDGNHEVAFSPDRAYYIDRYSRVDLPPIHELRRSSDGSLVVGLERADVSLLESIGWKPSEVFHAKGRDGQTDIWGIVHRPRHFDPTKKYPVIEDIYAGPHNSFVPKIFSSVYWSETLAELGFIVVRIDGMGTANRSKAFHDVCWHNVADAGLPDRILWIKALAAKYPQVDATRVGIYGTSAGGQSSTGAILFHPEFYKVAVSSCGCHDNRMDKSSWNEQWMGYPVGPHYAANSNITHAGKLKGKLLLIVGELDTNVPPESTLRLADALIKARKDFDFLLIPGMGHSDGGPYGERRRRDFFVKHLHGLEPPDRNVEASATSR